MASTRRLTASCCSRLSRAAAVSSLGGFQGARSLGGTGCMQGAAAGTGTGLAAGARLFFGGIPLNMRDKVAQLIDLSHPVVIGRMGDDAEQRGCMGGGSIEALNEVQDILGLTVRTGSDLGQFVHKAIGSPVDRREAGAV